MPEIMILVYNVLPHEGGSDLYRKVVDWPTVPRVGDKISQNPITGIIIKELADPNRENHGKVLDTHEATVRMVDWDMDTGRATVYVKGQPIPPEIEFDRGGFLRRLSLSGWELVGATSSAGE